ncbi:hypothetical protein AXF42_Ash015730 [Apostasia shenzhenica]|uniref:Avr9/Cf-9 rapidly elicited protein 146 n=1 Tax=Apostasia shenzhenica TaxID=1088818 RepID=A0A2H9ZU69_9ASPA|nr:hypothetical protein AXF42_Ash015730 [Apostasia shenzhenica]
MESDIVPLTIAKKLWHKIRVLYYMLRKGISKRKLAMINLYLLLVRRKIAGKSLRNLIAFHHHHHHATGNGNFFSFDCREVEFGCSHTPSCITKTRNGRRNEKYDSYDAAAVAKAFEMLNAEVSDDMEWVFLSPSPSPGMMWGFGRVPTARRLRVTDSPFPAGAEEEASAVDGGTVDKEAEEFIRRFYEQLRQQPLASAAATPEYGGRR